MAISSRENARKHNFGLWDVQYGEVICGDYHFNAPIFLINAFKIIRMNEKKVGIFRSCGSQKRVEELKKFYSGEPFPEDTPLNDLCGAVKAFFREMEKPLLTSSLEKEFIKFDSAFNRDDVRLRSIMQLCRVFDQRRRETLAFLMWQLKGISNNFNDNRMDVKNLAMTFAMSIFRDEDGFYGSQEDGKRDASQKASVIELLINNADKLCELAVFSEPVSRRQLAFCGFNMVSQDRKPISSLHVEAPTTSHSNLVREQKDQSIRELNNGSVGYSQSFTSTTTNLNIFQTGSSCRPSVSKAHKLATFTKVTRSISDSTEKKRRPLFLTPHKLKGGRPNSFFNGLKNKIYATLGRKRPSPIVSPSPIKRPRLQNLSSSPGFKGN